MMKPKPCKTCGTCPTCGNPTPPYEFRHYSPYYYEFPHITTTGSDITYTGGDTTGYTT